MITSEKQLTTRATTDTFDEIYTNYDVSVSDEYLAQTGYPFDYPTRWLNDPSQNKRIAIRRLEVTPTIHSFTLRVTADTSEGYGQGLATIDVTHEDTLIKVLNFICSSFTYNDKEDDSKTAGLTYEYDAKTNQLKLFFVQLDGQYIPFKIEGGKTDETGFSDELDDFLKFLNQPLNDKSRNSLTTMNDEKLFTEVWSRDRIHFHASFSTSRRRFIGKSGDFYQNLTLLYPPPTNESTFYIRFTSNGMNNILIRHCEFDVQLCFIVNYKNSVVL